MFCSLHIWQTHYLSHHITNLIITIFSLKWFLIYILCFCLNSWSCNSSFLVKVFGLNQLFSNVQRQFFVLSKISCLKMKSSEKRFWFLYLASVLRLGWSGCFVNPSSINHLLAFPKCDCNLHYFSVKNFFTIRNTLLWGKSWLQKTTNFYSIEKLPLLQGKCWVFLFYFVCYWLYELSCFTI